MVNTNELMLGNWVLHNSKPIKVAGVTENRIASFANEIGVRLVFSIKIDEIESISITDTLLEKCGFTKERNLWIIDESMIFEPFRSANVLCYYGQRIEGIKYLHELQNAYFMLTKKQLSIDL